ncbi:hypothetical protein OEZ86_004309 [Tetradesmus obliquus]|nr:hypothetical protein OEZ86_004309 [Tetradesmus obliquus]
MVNDEVFENGWHTGLGFPLKPMVLLEGCTPSRPEYYRAVVVRVEERKRLVTLQWVHVAGQRLFALPLGSPRIWTHSYKAGHWTQLQKKPDITAAVVNQRSQQLLAIPGVPLAAAVAAVRAGLRVQITGQQVLERAYNCFDGFGVWAAAFDAAEVPLEEWAADVPAELRRLCCCDTNNDDADSDANETSLSSLPPQLVRDLSPGRATDLLVVAFNVAAHMHIRYCFDERASTAVDNVFGMFSDAAFTAQLPAASVETLLRLVPQEHRPGDGGRLASCQRSVEQAGGGCAAANSSCGGACGAGITMCGSHRRTVRYSHVQAAVWQGAHC